MTETITPLFDVMVEETEQKNKKTMRVIPKLIPIYCTQVVNRAVMFYCTSMFLLQTR